MDDDVIIIEEYENIDEPDAKFDFSNRKDRKSHTALGALCFAIGVAGGLLEFVAFLFFGSSAGNSPLDLRGINSGAIQPIVTVAGVLLMHSIGVFVGVLSLVKREKSRAIPIFGLIANVLMIGTTVVFVGVAWLVK